MTTATNRIYLARLAGQTVYDPRGDPVGKLRDVVVVLRSPSHLPRVLGAVVEVMGRRRIFLPMTRVTSIDADHVITTGVLNVRRYEQRASESLVFGEILDRTVTWRGSGLSASVYDVAMEQRSNRDWFVTQVALRQSSRRFGRRGQTHIVEWADVIGLVGHQPRQGAANLLATMQSMRPADVANVLRDLSSKRRSEIVAELDDERLADVLEELPDTKQIEILGRLDPERAADVLEEMSSDDAADLVGGLPGEAADHLLALMEPPDAQAVRRLLKYEGRTAGGMMTTEPVILSPDATLADALARIREPELSAALAAMVYVCRPPLETPTGRFLGVAHIQRLLREPPSTLVGAVLDTDIDWPRPQTSLDEVAELLATYNMVACPVVDENAHLAGVLTVDDVLDHLLPQGWRDRTAVAGS